MPRLLRLPLSLLAVCCLMTVTTASAHQAGTVYMKINKAHASRPHNSSNLAYRGGPVSIAAAVYIVFWGDWSNTTQAENYVTGFFGNVGGSTWAKTTDQYCENASIGATSCAPSLPHPGNASGQLGNHWWNDTTNLEPSSPTQSQIASEASRLAAHFGVTPGANDDFMVFTSSGHSESGFGTQWCAYHSSSGSLSYSYMPYQPDAGASCGMNFVNANGQFDGFSIVGGHEYAETITDPEPNSGWLDSRGSEIGDKCAWIAPGSGPGGATDISLGSSKYAVQSLWSNAIGGCTTAS